MTANERAEFRTLERQRNNAIRDSERMFDALFDLRNALITTTDGDWILSDEPEARGILKQADAALAGPKERKVKRD